MQDELKHCPFCGGNARLVSWTPTAASVSCIMCGAHINTYTKQEAVEAWNARHERTCRVVSTVREDYEGGYAGTEYFTELSCGHSYKDDRGDWPEYCPWCGAKVVE